MNGKKLKSTEVEKFLLAGNATFTVVRPAKGDKSEVRYTFKLQRAKGDNEFRPWFAKVMTGPDNVRSFTFLGTVFPEPSGRITYQHSYSKSPIDKAAPSAHGIAWIVEKVSALRELAESAKLALAKGETVGPLFGVDMGDEVAYALDALDRVEVWHEGSCGRCGRKLTVPSSIETGLGPECAELV